MQEIIDNIFIEKYRASTLDELVFSEKDKIKKYLDNPSSIPSFIFYSKSPGTGKTSLAYIIQHMLKCDMKKINSSSERGIDTVREEVKNFARSMSSNEHSKRCIFMDEADGMTKAAQDSLRNLMEEYSDNVFFIFTANDISKIIEPIRSRCQLINFENPDKKQLQDRLCVIAEKEGIMNDIELTELVHDFYPDMRRMIHVLQEVKVSGVPWMRKSNQFESFFDLVKNGHEQKIYEIVYSGDFDCLGFCRWLMKHVFDNYTKYYKQAAEIGIHLAEVEKAYHLNCNLEIVFLAHILQICKLI